MLTCSTLASSWKSSVESRGGTANRCTLSLSRCSSNPGISCVVLTPSRLVEVIVSLTSSRISSGAATPLMRKSGRTSNEASPPTRSDSRSTKNPAVERVVLRRVLELGQRRESVRRSQDHRPTARAGRVGDRDPAVLVGLVLTPGQPGRRAAHRPVRFVEDREDACRRHPAATDSAVRLCGSTPGCCVPPPISSIIQTPRLPFSSGNVNSRRTRRNGDSS